MKNLLVLLLIPFSVVGQSTLNDLDDDGCVGATDILIILGQYGECNDITPSFDCGDSTLYDNYWYKTVLIGDQCWFAENLRTTVYTNDDTIPAGLSDGDWTTTTSGATALYGEGSSDCYNLSPDVDACDEAQSLAAYGRLYNWYAVDDARGLCPSGWHVPTDGEWSQLEDYITSQGFAGTEGTALKSTSGWQNNGNGTDCFGFTALPGGYRFDVNGLFNDTGKYGYWWSSSPSGSLAWLRTLKYSSSGTFQASNNRRDGMSVRCLRDAE